MDEPEIRNVSPREGYDLWASSYDVTSNPVVAMDSRYTLGQLAARRGERVLDAGCGTGRNLVQLTQAGCDVVGIDFSRGMLEITRRRLPAVPVAQVDLEVSLPFRDDTFDAALSALVGEHLHDPERHFREVRRVLRDGGRFVFSVYHPAMAQAGIEANFEEDGVEYRLGAVRHTVADYLNAMKSAGFASVTSDEHAGDEALVEVVPSAVKYVGFPILLVIDAR